MSMPNDPSKAQPQMPPTPRDFAQPTVSEMMPFKSTKINIRKSGILLPAAVTAITCLVLFSITGFYQMMDVITGYLLFVICYAGYAYSGLKKNLLIYLFPIAVVAIVLETPIFSIIAILFRHILPGESVEGENFIMSSVHYFFGAGMQEELTKAIPTLIGMFFAVTALNRPQVPGVPPQKSFIDYLKVTSPLEGMLFGLAAGASFIAVETLGQYIPDTVNAVTQTDGSGAGFANGFALLFPRVLQSIIGHMGWAAIFGYFIGLAAMYPRSLIKLVMVGWITAAVLHGFWDSGASLGSFALWIDGAVTLVIFVACFLKAKQLDTARTGNFVPSDSIIVGAQPVPASATDGFKMDEVKATAMGGFANLMSFANNAANAAQAAAAQAAAAVPKAPPAAPVAAAPAAVQQAPSAGSGAFALASGANRFGITTGQTIDLAMLFPGQGLPQPCLAEVTVNPKDASQLGLKNKSDISWTVTTDTGSVVTVGKGRNVKLAANEKIIIGSCIVVVQAL